jgi:hypothetical protein
MRDPGEATVKSSKLIWLLWPSFLVAGIGNAVFFTVFDPEHLAAFGEPVHVSRIAVHSIGFFAFWAMTITSNALVAFLQRPADDVNQCPFDPVRRPAGCPQGEEERCG